MIRVLAILTAALTLAAAPDAAQAKEKGCPPGLAKKSPACVTPGLAKKGVRADTDDDEEIADRYDYDPDDYEVLRTGDRVTINGQEYIVVRDGDRLVLKRDNNWFDLPGSRDDYVRVGDNLIRVDPKTKAVIEIIQLADLVLN